MKLLTSITRTLSKDTNCSKFILAACLAFTPLLSQANLIDNGSFESPALANGTWRVFGTVGDWHTVSGPGIEVQNNVVRRAQHGNQNVELDSHGNSSMSQQVSGLTIGETYELTYWYAARTNNAGNDNGIDVFWGTMPMQDRVNSIANVLASDGGWQ